jgi:hypothetical protein
MFTENVFCGSDFNYSANLSLPNNMTWSVSSWLTTTDLANLYNGNTEIGNLTSNLQLITTNLSNNINYTLNIYAPANLTSQWIANSVSIMERVLFLNTVFVSNTGVTMIANTNIVRVLPA